MILKSGIFIKVFITEGKKFRAQITNKNAGTKQEITVGGVRWTAGDLREYHAEILRRCNVILKSMALELQKIKAKE